VTCASWYFKRDYYSQFNLTLCYYSNVGRLLIHVTGKRFYVSCNKSTFLRLTCNKLKRFTAVGRPICICTNTEQNTCFLFSPTCVLFAMLRIMLDIQTQNGTHDITGCKKLRTHVFSFDCVA